MSNFFIWLSKSFSLSLKISLASNISRTTGFLFISKSRIIPSSNSNEVL
ncbi:MAG: hypothetical protein FWH29_08045 [Methanobrevibacter sp.]|nr:hypothetical protein [Methanobrevibacter sp.]